MAEAKCTTEPHILLAHNGFYSWYGGTPWRDPAEDQRFVKVWIKTADGTCWPVDHDGLVVNGNYYVVGINTHYMQVHWQVQNPIEVQYMQAVIGP